MARGDASTARGWSYPTGTSFTKDGADAITDAQDNAAAALTALETGTWAIAHGGTGATTAAAALQNLGIYVQNTDPGHATGVVRVWISW